MTILLFMLAFLCLLTGLLESIPLVLMRKSSEWFKACWLCNVITNPILNTILLLVSYYTENVAIYTAVLVVLEVIVVVVEAWIYHNLLGESWWKCLCFSFAANLLSFMIGILCVELLRILQDVRPERPGTIPEWEGTIPTWK